MQRTTDYFDAPCNAVGGIMEQLGHDRVDLLKLGIEGAECAVLGRLLEDGIHPQVLCVVDQPVAVTTTLRQISALRAAGYALANIEGWNYTFVHRGDAQDPRPHPRPPSAT